MVGSITAVGYAGHVCREDQTHADAAANSCQTVANRSDGTNHYLDVYKRQTRSLLVSS